ncbi:MAG: hypothetical protein JW940_39055 [Polyangiaceae bacterium]|nr:hypothetical protein [Polyangiaceae bacterium]
MIRHVRLVGVGLALAGCLFGAPGHAQSQSALTLPRELPITEPLVWTRVLSEPVGSFLVQGHHLWVRSDRPWASGGGDVQGKIHHFDGQAWTTSSLYDSYDAAYSRSQFIAGIGPGIVLAGIAFYCCGSGNSVVFEARNGRWQGVARPFPRAEFPGDSFQIAQGAAPIVCLAGNPGGCMRWVGGKGIPIGRPVRDPQQWPLLLDGRHGSNIAFSDNQLYTWRGGWKPVGDPLSEELNSPESVELGTQGRAWLLDRESLLLWDGAEWSRMPTPIREPKDLLEASPKNVWLAGAGGLSHFDGKAWSRVHGIYGELFRIAQGKGEELWIGSDTGLWHGIPRKGPPSFSPLNLTRATEVQLPKPRALEVRPGAFQLTRTRESIGKEQVSEALCMAQGDGQRWLYDRKSLHARCQDEKGTEQARAWISTPMKATPDCVGCLSVTRAGLAEITTGLVRFRTLQRTEPWGSPVGYPTAITSSPLGTVWVVGSGADQGLPLVARRKANGWESFANWPSMSAMGIASPDDDDLWIAAADHYEPFARSMQRLAEPLSSDTDAQRSDGLLDHLQGRALVRYHTESALLSVAKHPTENLVVAVGADGILVELRGTDAKVFRLRSRPWLYSVVSDGQALWVLGEHGTLLRRLDKGWTSVPLSGFVRPAFTTLVRDGDRWLVGGPEVLMELRPSASGGGAATAKE